ncbi:TPA: hypothetical protein CPT85_09590 [Candidatus Gastranaerophilales bacterium HUM_21]|nr:MAG TPA: hypothetical protein CPT85_09590 [Candidatus Gastranaerophilales bacterium HUM_21]
MANTAVCKKVSSMLSLYIDNKVSYQERAFIEDHLSNCEECYKKYIYLKSLIKNLKDSYKQVLELAQKKQKQATFSIREHEKFVENLSPYVDNELNAQECFEFRKYLMKSKAAQKELKNTYIMQKELRNAFDKAKKKRNADLTRNVMNSLKEQDHKWYQLNHHSEILNSIFTMKTAKIAILAGLVMLGAYEYKEISLHEKTEEQHVYVEKQNTNIPKDVYSKENSIELFNKFNH